MKYREIARRLLPRIEKRMAKGSVNVAWIGRLALSEMPPGSDDRLEFSELNERSGLRRVARIIALMIRPKSDDQPEFEFGDDATTLRPTARIVNRDGREFLVHDSAVRLTDAIRNMRKGENMEINGAKAKNYWRKYINDRWPDLLRSADDQRATK